MNDARKRLTMARQDQENLSVFSQEYDTLEKNKIIGSKVVFYGTGCFSHFFGIRSTTSAAT